MSSASNGGSVPNDLQHYYDLACEAIRRGEKLEKALREIAAYRVRPVDHPTLAYAEVVEIARKALDG